MTLNRRINATTTARLKPFKAGDPLTQPLFAINWFNTKRAWLYSLYNSLATGPAIKTGAKVFIKAELIRTLQGEPIDRRDMLLIVNYASGGNFLDLLTNKYFQIISSLRRAAVKDFSFVFHRRQGGPERLKTRHQKFDPKKAYAIHHFHSPGPLEPEFEKIKALASDQKISLHFASEKTAALALETKEGQWNDIPFVTEKLFLFEGNSSAQLEKFLTGKKYQAFTKALDFSYMGLLKRVM